MTAPLFTGKNLIELVSVDSTNNYAGKLLAEKQIPEGTAVAALIQLKGRGQAGNEWQSEGSKNLLISVIFYPSFLDPRHQFFLNQVASLAVADTLESYLPGSDIKIKWPNDVLVDEKKIAGILIENSLKGNTFMHSIFGIGMNVNQQKFDPALRYPTSLALITGKDISIHAIRQSLFSELETRYLQLKQQKIDLIQKDYMKRLFRAGESSWFISNGSKFRGKIQGLTAEGRIIIEKQNVHEVFGLKEIEMVL